MKLLRIVSLVFSIIAIMHFVAGAVFVWVFLPVGIALAVAGFIFQFIAFVFMLAADKTEKEIESQQK